MSNMTDAFAAGMIQGRGRLYTNSGGRDRLYRPQITVFCIDQAVADGLAEHFGLGQVVHSHTAASPGRPLYLFEARGQAALEVLERTAPYLVGKVRSHAEHILERDLERAS